MKTDPPPDLGGKGRIRRKGRQGGGENVIFK